MIVVDLSQDAFDSRIAHYWLDLCAVRCAFLALSTPGTSVREAEAVKFC